MLAWRFSVFHFHRRRAQLCRVLECLRGDHLWWECESVFPGCRGFDVVFRYLMGPRHPIVIFEGVALLRAQPVYLERLQLILGGFSDVE